MKLYQSHTSPHLRRIRIYLAEKGISMPLVPVDLGLGEQFSESYAAINPRRVVPTLVLDDGTAIGEVPAIIRYLEEIHPVPPLLGSAPRSKALVTMWERRAEQEGFASAMEAVRNAAPGSKAALSPDRTLTSRFQRWSSVAAGVSPIFMQTSMRGLRQSRLWRATNSRSRTLPPWLPSTSRPGRRVFRFHPNASRCSAGTTRLQSGSAWRREPCGGPTPCECAPAAKPIDSARPMLKTRTQEQYQARGNA
jgi:glutathione S-transferase